MNNLQRQHIQQEIIQLIRSIRHEESGERVLRTQTAAAQPLNYFMIICFATLMGALLVFIFLPMVNATKLFNSHLFPVMDLTPNHAAMQQNLQQPESGSIVLKAERRIAITPKRKDF